MPPVLEPEASSDQLADWVAGILDEMKAEDIQRLDVRHLTTITDWMLIASGRSSRHVQAIADALLEQCKRAGLVPLGVEGQQAGEWVLVDLCDVVVHLMLPRTRDFYGIEKLWDISRPAAEASEPR